MCARLLKGMTKSEIAAVIGEPTRQKTTDLLVYGREKRITIHFDEDTGEARFIYGCEWNELKNEVEKAQQRAQEAEEQSKKDAEWARAKRARDRKEEEILRKARAEDEKREQEKKDRPSSKTYRLFT